MKTSVLLCAGLLLYYENHAIVAWFCRALAVYADKKTPNVYNKGVPCQLRQINTLGGQ